MPLRMPLTRYRDEEQGTVLVFWGVVLVAFCGLLALTLDFGRMATTQTELQAFADNVALAAAGELDGRADAIERAEAAAAALAEGHVSFGDRAGTLRGPQEYELSFHSSLPSKYDSKLALSIAAAPQQARFVRVTIPDHLIRLGFGAARAALAGGGASSVPVAAEAVAGFELVACNVTPIAMCMPSVDFRAEAHVGSTLELELAASAGGLLAGGAGVVGTVVEGLGDTSVCAGLVGRALSLCLIAAKDPGSACFGAGGLDLSLDVSVTDIEAGLDVRFNQFGGATAGMAGQADFGAAANVLGGVLNNSGVCVPSASPPPHLPVDDCFEGVGACVGLGDGDWSEGRQEYVDLYYDGVDPFPEEDTRYGFYLAEVQAQNELLEDVVALVGSPLAGLLGGVGGLLGLDWVTGPLASGLCSPASYDEDPARRILTIAGVDCAAGVAEDLHVQQYFDVFVLGETEDGKLNVEIVACLGADCGPSPSEGEVRDYVRLYR